MKLLSIILIFFVSVSAFAHSNVRGVWIEKGQTLSIGIVDDPSSPPFTAGKIWKSIKDTNSDKIVKTPNLEIKCSGATQADSSSFGSCRIKANRSIVVDQSGELDFAISQKEAQMALAEFEQIPGQENILIKSGIVDQHGNDQFMFEPNWRYEMVATRINKSLISE